MAQVYGDQVNIIQTWRPWVVTIGVGAAVGLLYWIMTVLIDRYVIEPVACRDAASAMCLNSTEIAGNIAAVLSAVAGLLVLVRLDVARPILLAVGTAVLLWGMAGWTEGLFWLETIGWSMLLGALSYALFAWIARTDRLWLALVLTLVIVLAIRIALVF